MSTGSRAGSENPRLIAVFDIDGTLVRWQFFHAIVHELGKRGFIDAATHQDIRDARMQWKRRVHPDAYRDYEAVLVSGYVAALKHISQSVHEQVIEAVFEEYKDQLFTYTRDKLQQYRLEGRLIFAISGSHDLIVRKLAQHLAIDDYVGAKLELKDGKLVGIKSSPVHDKASALRRLVKKHHASLEGSIGIGDTESDIPMLALVEHPIAFNPTQGLFDEAVRRGWDVVVERKNVVYRLAKGNRQYVVVEASGHGA